MTTEIEGDNHKRRITNLERRLGELERRLEGLQEGLPVPSRFSPAAKGCACPLGTEWSCRWTRCPRNSASTPIT
jgi:hypothetical protein